MSEYKNITQVFPNRCLDILKTCYKKADEIGREVTLILAVSSASLVIPYERLGDFENPSGDARKYDRAKSKFENKCGNENFLDWIARGTSLSWKYKELDPNEIENSPVAYWLEDIQDIPEEKKVGEILNILRNAFAHGNIFTLSENKKIKSIVFLSQKVKGRPDKGYKLIEVLPEDLYDFSIKWVKFLNNLDMSKPQVN